MRSQTNSVHLPHDAIHVRTYVELGEYLAKFAARQLDLVLLLGRHGTGKTESVKRAVGFDLVDGGPAEHTASEIALYVEGHVQPFGLYQQLWEFRDRPVVLDDLDRLYTNADCIRLLKPLCNPRTPKRLSWLSNATLASTQAPSRFATSSNVMLVANEWRTLNANVRALEDRAIILHFDPSNTEIHRRVGEWFDDPEVYEFVASHLRQVPSVSMRHYDKARRLRRAGFVDWRASLLRMMIPDREVSVVAGLQEDPKYNSDAERLRRFMTECGRSRATYYRIKRRLTKASECR